MATDIRLKDLYDKEQSYTDIGTIAVPKTDGSGNTYYVQRPLINYILQDPPTHELTDADAGMFTWNAGDGTLIAPSGVADDGNVIGMVYAAKEGKTTKPLVRLDVLKNLTGIETGGSIVTLLYCWEEVTSANLKEIIFGANGSDLPEFTTRIGWGYLTQDAEGTVTGYAKIADASAVTIGIQQPNTIKEGPFYTLLAEESLEEKAVTITEKGAQTVAPTIGKSGMSKVNLQVDVAGGNLQEAKSQQFTAIYCGEDGDLGFYDPAHPDGAPGAFWVKPDDGYDGMKEVQITGKAKMLGQDDITVTDVSHHAVTFELKGKDGYIGFAQGSTVDANCYFDCLQNKKTGDKVPNAEIMETGDYDIITYMSATNVSNLPTGTLASLHVNVETQALSVFQILEEIDGTAGEKKILLENCVFTAADWLNRALNGKTLGYWLVKNNVQWNPTGVLNDDGTVTVNLGDWMKLSPTGFETVTAMVDETGRIPIDLGELEPKPSVAWIGEPTRLNGIVNEDGRVSFPWIYYKTGTAQMLPIETTT